MRRESSFKMALAEASRLIRCDRLLEEASENCGESWFGKDKTSVAHQDVVKLAYRDFQRTLCGWGQEGVAKHERVFAGSCDVLKGAFDKLVGLPCCNERSAFDDWHKETCDQLRQCWRPFFSLFYGQAQKWVNVGLKCHCAAGARSEYGTVARAYHQALHVPLDSVVFNGIRKAVDVPFSGSTLSEWFLQKRFPPWSRIDNYAEYLRLQEALRCIADAHKASPIVV